MPNRLQRMGGAFLVFGILPILGVFVSLIIIGSFGAGTDKTPEKNTRTVAVSEKISLAAGASAGAVAADDEPGTDAFKAAVLNAPNTTRDLAAKIAGEIIARNPQGPGPTGAQKLQLMKPSEVVDKLTAQSLAKFDPSVFSPTVELGSLTVIPDSEENFEAYFRKLNAILKERFSSVDLRGGGDLSKVNFAKASAAYAAAINELRALAVPSALAPLHKRELELVMAQRAVLQSLARYDSDALQAYLALNIGVEINNGFVALNKNMADFAAQHQLTL